MSPSGGWEGLGGGWEGFSEGEELVNLATFITN